MIFQNRHQPVVGSFGFVNQPDRHDYNSHNVAWLFVTKLEERQVHVTLRENVDGEDRDSFG